MSDDTSIMMNTSTTTPDYSYDDDANDDDGVVAVTVAVTVMIQQSHWQNVSIVIIGAVSGLLSCLGSGVILYSILSDWKRKQQEVKYRFLVGLSIADIVTSPVYFVFTLLMPKGSPNTWGAIGNQNTCTLQGFMLHLTSIGLYYNGALSHWFYCSICKGISDKAYIERHWDKRWHIVSFIFPIGTAIYLVVMEQFNYTPNGCYIGAYPYGCLFDEDVDCIRGEQWRLYAWIFLGIPMNIILIIVAYYMYQIFKHVKTVNGKVQRQIRRSSISIRSDFIAVTSQDASRTFSSSSVVEQHPDGITSSSDNENDTESNTTTPTTRSKNVQPKLKFSNCNTITTQEEEEEETAEIKVVSFKPTSSTRSLMNHPFKSTTTNNSQKDMVTKQDSPEEQLTGLFEESYKKLENRIQETAKQAYWYIAIYLLTHMWSLGVGILEEYGIPPPFWLLFLSTMCWPLQGLGNVFIFLRSRVAVLQKQYPGLSYWVAAYWSIFYWDDKTQKLRTTDLPEASKLRLSRLSLTPSI